MSDILSITGEPIFNDRIVKIETHTYNPYANTTFENSDEIRIPIQQQDLYILHCESFLYIEGRLESKKPSDAEGESSTSRESSSAESESSTRLVNNCAAFMFEEICYELDGVEIDRSRNVGITSTIKNYASLTVERSSILQNAGWDFAAKSHAIDDFNFCVPLSMLLVLNDINKLTLLRTLESGRYLSVAFRSWDLYEFPLLQSTTKHSWAVKAATQLEKPRYVIFALQSGRKNVLLQDASMFDDCKLTNVKLYLNSDFYPYDDMNLNFEKNKIAVLYDMYSKFRKTYYGCDKDKALFNLAKFKTFGPIVVIDCSRQNESIKSATVDVRIEFDCKENVPSNTTAYCLIIHDRVVEYNPLTNVVRRIV
ncbi:uncharacterized protein LOC126851900 [Cataglyphis hispanica]|uniref:uncharacterized protein LOC126851900 n=1 Tax=Cataglyphis hispanica TaxID=1086592 RepID=UPI00217F455C|nr:uncharacterized protein LOC126851900 [Cataglyphis hispanica]